MKRSATSGGPYLTIISNLNALSWTNTGLVNGATYHYVMSATDGTQQTPDSLEESATPNPPPPSAPGNLTAHSGSQSIFLSWNASSGATNYKVKRSSTSGGPYIVIASNVTTLNFTNANLIAGKQYYYVVSAQNQYGESADSAEVGAIALLPGMVTGTIIGTAGSWNNLGNTRDHVFDRNFLTYFDGPDASGDWVGLDLGTNTVISAIAYCPRASDGNPYPQRMNGGQFQGANNANFTNPTVLYTITTTPIEGTMTKQTITNPGSFRYIRYLGPNNSYCNVAELEFYGYSTPPPAPIGLAATAQDGQVSLTWATSPLATAYNLKRSTNGSSYAVIASNLTTNTFNDVTVNNGTLYYYIVSAANLLGEGPDSIAALSRPVSLNRPQLSYSVTGSQLQLSWPADHTGWHLQSQTNLLTSSENAWSTVFNSEQTNQASIIMGSAARFFRLISP